MKVGVFLSVMVIITFMACSENGSSDSHIIDGDIDGDIDSDKDAMESQDSDLLEGSYRNLSAGFADPILLTFAAARPRSQYMLDEGYTLVRQKDGTISFVTDTAGDLGLAFKIGDEIFNVEDRFYSPIEIDFTASDSCVLNFDLVEDLKVVLRFTVTTSRVAEMEIEFTNRTDKQLSVEVLTYLRRCYDSYTNVNVDDGQILADHNVETDPGLLLFAPGTYLENLRDALVSQNSNSTFVSLKTCGSDFVSDAIDLWNDLKIDGDVAVLGFVSVIDVPALSSAVSFYQRGVVDLEKAETMDEELALARSVSVSDVILEGSKRLEDIPDFELEDSGEKLLYRSSFVLLDQLFMPAEGNLKRDYYLFGREPSWWFGRLGQHIHESMAMIMMARFKSDMAVESQRIFIDNINDENYLPYNIGPVVIQDAMGTASAPLFSYVSWEVAKLAGNVEFLEEAYQAGKKLNMFWLENRDKDADGLAEWGGYALTESVRDLENVIWENVAPPENLEALGANCMLVMEEKSLAQMATALGKTEEAEAWMRQAQARGELINRYMWDEETGFYYHVNGKNNTFTYENSNDLKRMEIVGFMPLWAGIANDEKAKKLLEKLTDENIFWRLNGVPGLAATDEYYSPDASRCCRWNGPVWVQWQWLIMRALLDMGEIELAAELTERIENAVKIQLEQVHQFRELYNPDDAVAVNNSMPNYIWSAMATLMMIEIEEYSPDCDCLDK